MIRESLVLAINDADRALRLVPSDECRHCAEARFFGYWLGQCEDHYIDSRLLRADDWLTDHMAAFTWATAVATIHGPEDHAECSGFANAYAKAICKHVARHVSPCWRALHD